MNSRGVEDILPLSPLQQGLLFHAVYDEDSADIYAVQLVLDIEGPLNAESMRLAAAALLHRHGNLRAAFLHEKFDEPVQVIPREGKLPWSETDLSGVPEAGRQAEWERWLAADRARRFDLTKPPLIRFALVTLTPGQYRLVISNHHILLDGWSMPVLLRELFELYGTRGDASALPRVTPYRDYLAWLAQQDQPAAEAAWSQAFSGLAEPSLIAPVNRGQSHSLPERVSTELSVSLTEALAHQARSGGHTLNTLLQAAWATVVGQLTGRDDVVLGMVVSGRPPHIPGIESMVGLLINTLPARVTLNPAETFGALVHRLQAEQAALTPYHHVSLTGLQQRTGVGDLFDTCVVVENYPVDTRDLKLPGDGIRITGFDGRDATHYSAVLTAIPGERTQLRLDYQTDVFDRATAESVLGRVLLLLEQIAERENTPVGRLELLSAVERERILVEWNPALHALSVLPDGSPAPVVSESTLVALFEAQAARTPQATAVTSEGTTLSYAQLDARSNQLARHLIAQGVGPEQLVALALPRTEHMIVALLAVLKAGAGYLPVDPDYPADRITYMLQDARPTLVLTSADTATVLDTIEADTQSRLVLDDPAVISTLSELSTASITDAERIVALTPSHPAYVIYTSGSTGRPKGVVIPHQNVTRLFSSTQHWFDFGTDDVWTMFHSYAFDFSVWEIWGPLLHGGRLLLVPYATSRSPQEFRTLLTENGVTVLNQTPSAFYRLIQEEQENPDTDGELALRTVIFGGEALDLRRLDAWYAHHPDTAPTLINMYGITETTVHVTYRTLDRHTAATHTGSTIGEPIPDLQVYVLDTALRPVPAGVPGELYVAGHGLARGYLNRPALTAERFPANPYSTTPGARMYRTGDIVRWTTNGELEYHGRTDDQVKIRGFRIELGEIETTLNTHPTIAHTTVQAREDQPGNKQLVAYLIAAPGRTIDTDQLRAHAAETLPDYMVPAAFITLDALPLTANGKLDRKALPAPDFTTQVTTRAPRNEREELLCALFAEVLDLDSVGVDDSFFNLGGHSLTATRLVSRIRADLKVELSVRSLFQAPTVAGVAALIGSADTARKPLGAMERPAETPLSPSQNRLWFLNRLEGVGGNYNLPVALRLTGALDVKALELAFSDVVARHESLRTVFPETDGVPRQEILSGADVRLEPQVSAIAEEDLEQELAQAAIAGFDLATEIPIRLRLFQLAPDAYVLLVTLHHIAGDGWSMGPLSRDLSAAYTARCAGAAPRWEPLPVQYADYTLWQREVLGDESDPDSALAQQIAYWRTNLADSTEELALPTDRPRPTQPTRRGADVPVRLDTATHQRLLALSQDSGSSLFMVLQAGVAALLTRHGAGEDIPIGSPIAGRTDVLLDDLVGFFVNTLVLRTDTSGDPTFRELLDRVRETDLAAYAHQDLAFERLVELLNPTRSLARHPLFQVFLSLHNNPETALALNGVHAVDHPVPLHDARFDLTFELAETLDSHGGPAGISGRLEFARDLFDEVSARRLAEGFVRLLEAVAADPGVSLGAVDVLSPEERARVVSEWNDTSREVTAGSLVSVFEAQVARTPESPAVVFEGQSLSYAQFNARVNQLAHELVARGVAPGDFVAVAVPRSLELVTALYAVVKAGAAYVPVDPDYPTERINSILQDATPTMVLTTSTIASVLPDAGVPVLLLDGPGVGSGRPDANPDVVLPVNAAAYVIFTSGSTGRPKGVVIGHDAINNRLAWMQHTYPLDATDRVLQKTPSGFDVSVWEFFWPLQTGATLVVARPEGHKDPAYLARVIQDQQITTTHFVPSMLQAFLTEPSSARITTLRRVICSGEALPPEAVHRFHHLFDGVELHNLYGPTEAAVDVTAHTTVSDAVTVPIGRPIWNTQTYILDSALRPVPVGVPGELYLAGTQLAHGYTHQPTLTAERFTANPFTADGQRMYRTGDLARWTPHGELEYHGRTDDQIKLRGLRIELGDIETTLTTHPTITHTTVQLREDQPGNKRLVAYLVPAPGQTVDTTAVREHAAALLPDYMIPAAFITLAELPLTANGKLDRKALPAPDFTTHTTTRTPRNPREELLTTLFADILGLDTLGIDDNFFTLGGHSLLATRLISRIRTTFGVELALRAVFDEPTVAGLAGRLSSAGVSRQALSTVERPEEIPLSAAQRRLWFLNRLEGPNATYNLPLAVRLQGTLDVSALQAALEDVVTRHESLRTIFPDTDGRPRQDVLSADSATPELIVTDVAANALDEQVKAASQQGFDLAHDQPLRAHLFRTAADDHVLLLVIHHIAGDGWSMAPLSRDLSSAYRARSAGDAPAWRPLPVQYADYTLWQSHVLGDENDPESALSSQLDYWRAALSGIPEELELPTDRPRPAVATSRGERIPLHLPPRVHQRMTDIAHAQGASVFMVTQAAIAALLGKLGAGDDIPIGSVIAGRTDEALDDLVGFFVNTLVLRTDLSGNPTFRELVERVKETGLAAYANQDVPFERLVDDLSPDRSLARHPLFQVMLSYENNAAEQVDIPGTQLTPYAVKLDVAKFDLSFQLVESFTADGAPAGIGGAIEFATDLFDASTAQTVVERLERLLDGVLNNPDAPASSVEILSAVERERILVEWNPALPDGSLAPLVSESTLVALFEAQAARTPQATAVTSEGTTLSYAQLDARSNQLARHLIAQGVGPEQLVALALPRTEHMIVALLAVLKAGAGYLPVDPDYPADRITYMLQDARPALVLTSTDTATALDTIEADTQSRLVLDDPELVKALTALPAQSVTDAERVVPLSPSHPAYVIYTSGSTGRPKGVVIPHQNVTRLFSSTQHWFDFGTDDVWTMFHSYAFDFSVWEIWGPLLHGGRLLLVPYATSRSPQEFRTLLTENGVTVLNQTPSAFYRLIQEEQENPDTDGELALRTVIFGGEALDLRRLDAWYAHHPDTAPTLINMYGITETTVHVTYRTLDRHTAATHTGSTIGEPIPDLQVYVLDTALRPVPAGVPGELYVAGHGLARGYLNRPALTAERFPANPYSTTPGARMYRTGDIVRWTTNGELEYHGRTDDQVKIRGFRIELGEIETTLNTHPTIAHTTVQAREDQPGNKRLVAYVVPAPGQTVDTTAVREHAAGLLPDYMVPAAFVTLAELPLTANGKLDRKALPAPDFTTQVTTRAPRNEREELLCGLFAEVLDLDSVGVDDSFFELGGDSIVSIQLVSRARSAGLLLTPRDIFQHRTVEALAAIAQTTDDTSDSTPRDPDAGIGELPATPIMHWLAETGGPIDGFNQAMVVQAPATTTLETLTTTLQTLLDHHDILRLRLTRTEGDPWALNIQPRGAVQAHTILRRVDTTGIHGDDLRDLMAREIHPTQQALDPDAGTMLQAVWFDADHGTTGRLLLMAHHLVIDGVSWRILLPDLATAHQAITDGVTPELPPVGTSFRSWALGLTEAAASEARSTELDVWTSMLQTEDPQLGNRPLDPDRDTATTTRTLSLTLPPHITDPLLTTVPAAFHAGVNDILLAGFALAVADWRRRRGQNAPGVLVDLEGHGREELVPGADISRTIGWFTSLFPVNLNPTVPDNAWPDIWTGGPAIGNAIKAVKEQLHTLPDNGAGYGLLRHLNPHTATTLATLPTPQISFNYLGRFNLADGDTESSDWDLAANTDTGNGRDPEGRLSHALEVNALTLDTTEGGSLVANWTWPEALFAEDEVQELATAWFRALEAIVTHTERPTAGGHTPSDFALVHLTQREIDELGSQQPQLVDVLPLAPLQQGLLFHALFDEQGSDVYSVQMAFDFEGRLDADAMKRAAARLLDRHANLRAGFHSRENGEPVQVIPRQVELPWTDIDLSSIPEARRQDEMIRLVAEDRVRRFDLTRPPLVRFTLFAMGPERHRLLVTNHHILLDGWSTPVLINELFTLYSTKGDDSGLPRVTPYRDYLAWLTQQDRSEAEAAWADEFAELEEPTLLAGSSEGADSALPERLVITLSDEETTKLLAQTRQLGVTTNTVVQAAWALLLGGLTGRDDVVFGATVSGRPAEIPGIESMVGLFINTLPVRVRIDPAETLGGLLTRIQGRQTELMPHHHIGLNDVQRLTGHSELFDTLVVFENYPIDDDNLEQDGNGLHIVSGTSRDATHYPLSLIAAQIDTAFELRLDYRPDIFDRELIATYGEQLRRMLGTLATQTELPVGRTELLSSVERVRVVSEWNDTGREVTAGSLVSVFEAQVARTPESPAVVFEGQSLSYAQFNARVNQLAHELVARGVTPGDFVAVAVPRSLELVTALYAVVKAGAAYVPVDPDYPTERINSILQDATPTMVLTTGSIAPALPDAGVPVLLLDAPGVASGRPDANLDVMLPVNAAAYVIFTSGSTGRPKGVVVGHVAINNRLAWMQHTYPLDATDRVLQKTPSGFDVSVWEFFWPLQTGATLVVARPEGHKDPAYLAKVIQDQNITTTHFVPSMLQAFLTEPSTTRITTLRRVICSGEALPAEAVHRFHDLFTGVELHNLYGPTEAAVDVTAHTTVSDAVTVPIGRPIWNTQTYILDSALRPVPVGVPGELYLAGTQLAHGYTHQPTLTAERFTANPYSTTPGARMYRTGDLARWTTHGELEYHGRTDDQIKLRGLRIELGDIETTLTTHPTITHTTVQLREDQPGNKRLVAYLVPAPGQTVDTTAVREYTAALLPDYMVPAAFITLDALPLTANGKLDRKALPAPDFTTHTTTRTPRNPREELLAQLFADVLGLDTVGIDDNFFELGGDSIVSIQLVSRARSAGLLLTPRDIFRHRTVEALAVIAQATDDSGISGPQDPDAGIGELPATPIMQWLAETGGPIDGFNQAMVVQAPATTTLETLTTTLQTLLDHHDILRLRLTRTDGEPWALTIQPRGAVQAHTILRRVDTTGIHGDDLRDLMTRETRPAQQALDPDSGTMLQAVWFDADHGTTGRLLLMAHHLVIDGVSWRILLPDLATAHQAAVEGREADFGQVGTSFRAWAQGLAEEASSVRRTAELGVWTSMLQTEDPQLGKRPLDPDRDTATTTRTLSLTLPPHITDPLLTTVPAAFHAGVNDILLTGFALAVADWRHHRDQDTDTTTRRTPGVLVDLEGHGREELVPGADISRTIGWFTSLFPVNLNPTVPDNAWPDIWTGGPAIGNAIKAVKEQLHTLPDNGAGYGLLRHLNPHTATTLATLPTPQISFNYLGRFNLAEQEGSAGTATAWSPAPEADSGVSGGSDDDMRLRYAFVLSAAAVDGPDGASLVANWSWPQALFGDGDVRELAETWFRALEAIVTHTERPTAGGHTPSDLSLAGLSQDEIDEFEDELGL